MSAGREMPHLGLTPLCIALPRHKPGVNSQLQHVNSELQRTSSGWQHNPLRFLAQLASYPLFHS